MPVSQLHELRRILLEEEQQSLDELRGRIDDAEARTSDVAEILPAALRVSSNGEELVDALRDPVSRVIHDSVRDDPDSFADALFPVMGPAIRKAVAESIRALADRINKTVEQSVSWNGLKWRIEAARTGVPLADIIVRETLLYDTEEVFVIHRESGLLMAHLDKDDRKPAHDSDAVSAMLTAIQDFVRDSFGGNEQSDLDSVRIGGRTVWISYGPHAMLAVVYSGNPPIVLHTELHPTNEAIHRRYGDAIEHFHGDRSAFAGIEPMLRPLMKSAARSREGGTPTSYKPLIVGFAVIALLFALWFAYGAITRGRVARYVAAVAAIPGIVVIDASERDGATLVRILRDPLTKIPDGLAAAQGLAETDVTVQAASFLSNHPDLILERVRRLLDPPTTVKLAWRDDVIEATGSASNTWIVKARSLPVQWTGVRAVDFAGVVSAEGRLLAELRARYEVPGSVQLALAGDSVRGSGSADIEWLMALEDTLAAAPGDVAFDISAIETDLGSLARYLREQAGEGDAFAYDLDEDELGIYGVASFDMRDRLSALIERFGLEQRVDTTKLTFVDVRGYRDLLARYEGFRLVFTGGISLTDESALALDRALPDLARLAELGAARRQPFGIRVIGYTDGSGRPTLNEKLRRRRAELIANRLTAAGVPAGLVETAIGVTPPELADDRSWRRVEISFE